MQGAPVALACLLLLYGCADTPAKTFGTETHESSISAEYPSDSVGTDEEADDPFISIERHVYPELPDRFRVERLATLPDEVSESSGLAYRKGHLWTHNDSGHDAMIFELTESGDAIRRHVHPLNSENEDWEAMAQDEDTLYIADCGNNMGDRIWMQIYKVAWQDLDVTRHQGVVASESLRFRLADTRPARQRHAHNNDCEALTVVDDELWLFTKNWQNNRTRLYRVDKNAPVQQLTSSGEYPAEGLITGADYDPMSQRLALIGYRLGFLSATAFIWIIPVKEGNPDWEQGSRHSITPVGQWEAILWYQGDLLVTRETSVLGRAQLGIIRLP